MKYIQYKTIPGPYMREPPCGIAHPALTLMGGPATIWGPIRAPQSKRAPPYGFYSISMNSSLSITLFADEAVALRVSQLENLAQCGNAFLKQSSRALQLVLELRCRGSHTNGTKKLKNGFFLIRVYSQVLS